MLPGLFVLAGIGAGLLAGGRLELRLDPATLAVFLPGLIFDGAWQIAPVRLSRVALPVGFLAVPGVAVGAAATAAVIVASGLLGWPAAAALGAILAATDPVAVLAVFRRLPVAPTLRTLVEAESIANDAVAVALLQTALVVGTIAATGEPVVLRAAVAFAFSLGIGIAAGAIAGALGAAALPATRGPVAAFAVTFGAAYLAYFAADAVAASGIIAAAACALVARRGIAHPSRIADEAVLRRWWGRFAGAANACVFGLLGASLPLAAIAHAWPLALVALGAVVLVRIGLAALVPLRGLVPRTTAWRVVIATAGLRGGLPVALAVGLPAAFPQRELVVAAVGATVVATLVVQGTAIGPIVRALQRTLGESETPPAPAALRRG